MENFRIDPEAKPPIFLKKVWDSSNNPYYIGKLQFPATLIFDRGISFFVFVSEDGYEELQIAPMDPSRRSRSKHSATMSGGRFSIDLHPVVDRNGSTYYVGEAVGFAKLDLYRGVFFTIFLSKPGQEEIQITRLNHRQKKREPSVEYRNSRVQHDSYRRISEPA